MDLFSNASIAPSLNLLSLLALLIAFTDETESTSVRNRESFLIISMASESFLIMVSEESVLI